MLWTRIVVWSTVIAIACLFTHVDYRLEAPSGNDVSRKERAVLLAIAVITMLLCTKSSPLYPLNDWVDANAYFTVGKSMLKGLVPYRDLFEHKGPLLYMLHFLAAAVSFDSFVGVYIIETVCAFVFLTYSYKTMRLFFTDAVFWYMPLFAAFTYSVPAFSHGDSVEELCLPILSYAIYVSMKALRNEQMPSFWECFVVGMTSACMLWMKFTILGFYAGWIIVPTVMCVKKRKVKELMRSISAIAAGVVATTLPILAYFGAHGALADLFEVYFYDNLFVYGNIEAGHKGESLLVNLIYGLFSIFTPNPFCIVTISLSIIYMIAKKDAKYVHPHYAATLAMTFFGIYCGGRYYAYYALTLSAFSAIGFGMAAQLVHENIVSGRLNPYAQRILACIVAVAVGIIISPNTYMLSYAKEDLPQYAVKGIIDDSGIENPTLLNYGYLDAGFYTTTGIVPSERYFYKPNLPLEEITQQQTRCLTDGRVDFVVALEELAFDKYESVADFTYFGGEYTLTYYLYKLRR